MKKFKLEVTCENAAFCDDGSPESAYAASSQVALILRDAAKHVENGCDQRTLMDVNGNTVGHYHFIDTLSKADVFTNWPAADIARCKNGKCSVRESCIRWITRDQKHARNFISGQGGPDCPQFVNDGSYTPK